MDNAASNHNLSHLDLKDEYRTDSCNIVDEFYIPCLEHTKVYSRATGYFTSDSLSLISKGLSSLISNGGKMRLIASPDLKEEDIEAIQSGLKKRDEIILESCKLIESENLVEKSRLAFLEKLISSGLLEVKLAIRNLSNGKYGIYHEKIGVFLDGNGNYVSFTGSNNETKGGLENNFESCNVFCSWDEGVASRAKAKLDNFEKLWGNSSKGLEVIDFTEQTAEQLLKFKKYYKEKDPETGLSHISSVLMPKRNVPQMPSQNTFTLRDYQKEAIEKWVKNDGKGFFEMCTGAGKTKTAISAIALTYKALHERLFVLVIAPYQHLVTQWTEELKDFNIEAIQVMGDSKKWIPKVSRKITEYNSRASNFTCLISTNASFSTEKFNEIISSIKGDFLIVADEAHNLGSSRALKYLPKNANYRIALSATPVRHHDEEGTEALIEYFGEPVINFTLKDALDRGFLTKYFYHIVPVYLDTEESEEFERLSVSIERISIELNSGSKKNKEKEQLLESLLFKRSRLVASAKNKIPKLKEVILKNDIEVENALFYCGDGKLIDQETNIEERQIKIVSKMLGNDLKLKIHQFTSQESLEEREKLKQRFIDNDLDALVAIRCLDEGVDIPKIKLAFILASTTNPKQFIQRRGRVLRKFEGKNHSIIYDFLVLPAPEIVSYKYSKNLVSKELERINEFADLAINGPDCLGSLREIKKKYKLLDK